MSRARCCRSTTRRASSTSPAGSHELGCRAGVVGRHGRGRSTRPGVPVTTVEAVTGLARDARPPRDDAAPEDPRRHPRRPRQAVAPRRPRGARHRAVRPRRVATSTRSSSARRSRRSTSAGPTMVRAAAKNHAWVGDRHEPGAVRRRCSTSCATRRRAVGDDTRRALALEAFAHTAAYDAAIVRWLAGRRAAARSTSCSRSSGPTTMLRYGENPHQQAARYRVARHDELVGRRRASTAGSRSRTSTSTTPTPRGSSVHDLGDRAGRARSSSTPTRAASRSPTTSRPRTSARSSATSGPRSAASSRVNRPIDAATVERDGRRPAGRRGDRARLRAPARSRR